MKQEIKEHAMLDAVNCLLKLFVCGQSIHAAVKYIVCTCNSVLHKYSLCMQFVHVCMHVCVGEGGEGGRGRGGRGGEGERGRGGGEGVELPLELCVRLLTAVVCNRILYSVPSSCQTHSP